MCDREKNARNCRNMQKHMQYANAKKIALQITIANRREHCVCLFWPHTYQRQGIYFSGNFQHTNPDQFSSVERSIPFNYVFAWKNYQDFALFHIVLENNHLHTKITILKMINFSHIATKMDIFACSRKLFPFQEGKIALRQAN